ncbi:glycoside hydrolase superfamily [Crepidotus variabilis]|uniref:Glycoside hydrolase superfamily n=1 Tax=Crepidotus variabilis TaxID=179855 RepID=A0A9P6JQP0_9AGAR|nr:glycoside hydrolase superfamily [Crepidotus variabilis]
MLSKEYRKIWLHGLNLTSGSPSQEIVNGNLKFEYKCEELFRFRRCASFTMAPSVSITNHTTSSSPRPHILYTVQANINGNALTTKKRYSEFVGLHVQLNDRFSLPPKRILATTFFPSAWADDTLISERKDGLTAYLQAVLSDHKYRSSQAVTEFLAGTTPTGKFDLEDALPSTLSRKAALSLATAVKSGDVEAAATPVSGAYYPDWSVGNRPPEGIDFSKFDVIWFAFVLPNSSSTIDWSWNGQSVLQRLVTSARNSGYGTKIVLSVGGWGGCAWFSQSCSSASNRNTLAGALVSAINQYGLDGVDLDWEYPNSPGAGNPYGPNDAANLLSFVTLLRSWLGPSKIISAAVAHLPWLGSNGQPLYDVSAYAAQMSYVNIMNYDVWGASANPGPNAPMANLCGTSWQPQASAQAALNQWTAAGFPASKLLLGVPLYGYVSQSSKTVLTGSLMPSASMLLLQQNQDTEIESDGTTPKSMTFLNGAHPNPSHKEGEVTIQADLRGYWGQQIAFKDIVGSGAIVKRADGNYGEGGGFTMAWDNCSNTPYLYNAAQTTVVTYDDTWSLADKASFARDHGMGGAFTWSLDQDDGLTLQNAIRGGLGK